MSASKLDEGYELEEFGMTVMSRPTSKLLPDEVNLFVSRLAVTAVVPQLSCQTRIKPYYTIT